MADPSELMRGFVPTPEHPLVVVTGAGLSAPSGIPTFRGAEGYWTVGSRQYHPQEMATHEAWTAMPREVWRWYLFRRGVCRRADPNEAHRMLARLERRHGDGLRIVTQNVDGLHVRAGNTLDRIAQVHGDIDLMRDTVTDEVLPMPPEAVLPDREAGLTDEIWALLVNPRTGHRCRPHILWFDEFYEEHLYRSDTAVRWGRRAGAVVVIGTSGAARMPWLVAQAGMAAGCPLIDVNPEDNPFRELAARYAHGGWLAEGAVEGLASLAGPLL